MAMDCTQSMRWVVLGCAVLLTGQTGLAAQPDAAPRSEAVLRSELEQTLDKQDLEGAIALYEPDAVFLSPAGRFSDRAAIRTLYRSVFMTLRGEIAMTSKRVVTSSSLDVDDGSYSETVTDLASGKKTAVGGDYVLVARQQQDGSWRVAELVWTQTSAKPLP